MIEMLREYWPSDWNETFHSFSLSFLFFSLTLCKSDAIDEHRRLISKQIHMNFGAIVYARRFVMVNRKMYRSFQLCLHTKLNKQRESYLLFSSSSFALDIFNANEKSLHFQQTVYLFIFFMFSFFSEFCSLFSLLILVSAFMLLMFGIDGRN